MARSPKSISKTHSELSLKRELNNILEIRTEGASAIERAALILARKILDSNRLRLSSKVKLLCDSFDKIHRRFSLMANILNLCNLIDAEINDMGKLPTLLDEYQINVSNHRMKTIAKAAEEISGYNAIFTLSNSSMVREAILLAAKSGWDGKVYIVESRPQNEGILLAKKLAKAEIKVMVGVDLLMEQFIGYSDAVVLGADCVTESYFVNKIGSGIAVGVARQLRKPVYVLADKSKMISQKKFKFIADSNPSDEVSPARSKNIGIVNQYFEIIEPIGNLIYIYGDKQVNSGLMARLISE